MQTAELPPGEPPPRAACDCHAHVYGQRGRYPLCAAPRYAPPPCTLADYQGMLARLGISRAVVVQPTVYATNAVTEDALAAAKGAWRGVAKFAAAPVAGELARLHAAGFRGVRLHGVSGEGDLRHIEEWARRIAPFGWHIQLHMDASRLVDLERTIASLPVPVVHDHFARLDPESGVDSPPMRSLLRLLAGGRSWVKLSAPYLVSKRPPPYPDLVPIARACVSARPDRVVWGTDWPHPSHDGQVPEDADLLRLLAFWIPERQAQERILVGNPAALYGFETP